MSQENVEIARKAAAAISRGDPDAFVDCLSPSVEWEESGDVFPGMRGTYRGHAEARRWFEEAILGPWESILVEVEEITETRGERAFVVCLATARGRTSGVVTELRFWLVVWFADGKIAVRRNFGG